MVPNNHVKFEAFTLANKKVIIKVTWKFDPVIEAILSALETMAKMSDFSRRVKFSELFLKKHPMGY